MGLISNIISGALGITASLTQTQTNGASVFGTLNCPTLPKFLTNNPLPNGFPWGSLTAAGSNPYTSAPNTGVIRTYDFTLSRGTIAPDGYEKAAILVNGQFPGPQITANWGDTIQVTVHNNIEGPEEGTSIHWHGFLQKKTPWYDGVPSVQQCPIAPGSSFTYTFQAELYGTSWYHSHYSAQYADGAMGPIVIYGPPNEKHDVDLGPVMLTDWYHTEYFKLVEQVLSNTTSSTLVYSDNNLINGKMNFDCTTVAAGDTTACNNNAGISKFTFQTGKTHKLRLINAGAEGLQRFSIDGHNMTVVANDFVPINPYTTKVVTLGVGQRADVLVTTNQGSSHSAFWMRSNISLTCSLTHQGDALAAIYYDKADTTKPPNSTAWNVPDPLTCANDDLSLTVPTYKMTPGNPAVTKTLEITLGQNETGYTVWSINNSTFRGDYNSPVLLLAKLGNYAYPHEWNVENFFSNTSIRIIINNPVGAAHPMHLHGHNMYILSEGPGTCIPGSSPPINTANPQRRDVQMLRPNGYMVMQYDADNPGVWPLHCHIAWHVSAGLYTNLMEMPGKILSGETQVPSVMAQTCRDWAAYTGGNVVDQIDSGL